MTPLRGCCCRSAAAHPKFEGTAEPVLSRGVTDQDEDEFQVLILLIFPVGVFHSQFDAWVFSRLKMGGAVTHP